MKKRTLAVLLALTLGLTGCGGAAPAADQGASSGTAGTAAPTQSGGAAEAVTAAPAAQKTERAASGELCVGIAQDFDSLDPHHMTAAGTKEVLFNVFEGLVKPTPEGDIVPAVASEVKKSADGLRYSFTLREGVRFHNGDPVELGDLIFSIERRRNGEDAAAKLAALDVIDSMEADEEHGTLTITLKEPSNEFLANIMTAYIIPEGYEDQETAPIGTGPYKFVSRTAQESLVLERFPDYWGTAPAVEKVTFRIIETAEGLILGLQSGALDLVMHLTATQIAQLSPSEFYVEVGSMNLVQALYLNNAAAPLDDARVRRALCYAADKQGVIDLAFDGYGIPLGTSMYPSFTKYYDDTLTDYYPHDIARAKELLAEAGYPDGFDLTITVPSNYQPHVDAAEVLKMQFEEIGVHVTILPVEWGVWLSDVYGARQFQSTITGLTSDNMTARKLLERFGSGVSNNFTNYSNAEYDDLLALAVSAADDGEQTLLYRELERNLTENAANVYLQDMADLVAIRNGLNGLSFYPLYVLDIAALRWA